MKNASIFSKGDTLFLKGVAILMMLFLHLFHGEPWISMSNPQIYVNNESLVQLLSNASNPVYIYIYISGYGLYISYCNSRNNNIKRILKLYLKYWLTLIIFVPIGLLMVGSEQYPGNYETIIKNLTGWKTTYNGTLWFLFPYMLLSLSSRFLFKIYDKAKLHIIFVVTFIIHFVCIRIVSLYGEFLYSNQYAYIPEHFFELLFPFTLGMLTAKYLVMKQALRVFLKSWGGYFVLALIVVLVISIRHNQGVSALIYPYYIVAFCLLLVVAKKNSYLIQVIKELGRKSTSMWFIHAYFCWYFFSAYLFYLKYPLIIFFVLVVISYVFSFLIDFIYNKIIVLLKI